MTTAFELGCLSAMEKVAAEPNTASNYGNALQAAQKKITYSTYKVRIRG
jgi:hypothetical protein